MITKREIRCRQEREGGLTLSDSAAPLVVREGRTPWRMRLLASVAAGIVGMLLALACFGLWVGSRVGATLEAEVGHRAAMMLESTLKQHVEELEDGQVSASLAALIDRHYQDVSQSLGILEMLIWASDGRVMYASSPGVTGQQFPVSDELREALAGRISVGIETDSGRGHAVPGPLREFRHFEIYVPIRQPGSDRIVAVAEYYQNANVSTSTLLRTKWQVWGGIVLIGLIFASVIFIVFRNGDRLMTHQQRELSRRLTGVEWQLESQRRDAVRLEQRARQVEQQRETQMRQLNADIHDGIGQLLTVALMRIKPRRGARGAKDEVVQQILEEAMREVRALLSGTSLSDPQDLPLDAAVTVVARAHEQRTGTRVGLTLDPGLPDAPLPVRIAACRAVREGLHNAYKHAGGSGQRVALRRDGDMVEIDISDDGKQHRGAGRVIQDADHVPLGLVHLRHRIEQLGGTLATGNTPSGGMQLVARLPLTMGETVDA